MESAVHFKQAERRREGEPLEKQGKTRGAEGTAAARWETQNECAREEGEIRSESENTSWNQAANSIVSWR